MTNLSGCVARRRAEMGLGLQLHQSCLLFVLFGSVLYFEIVTEVFFLRIDCVDFGFSDSIDWSGWGHV